MGRLGEMYEKCVLGAWANYWAFLLSAGWSLNLSSASRTGAFATHRMCLCCDASMMTRDSSTGRSTRPAGSGLKSPLNVPAP